MNISDLDTLKAWFPTYVAGFAGPDGSLHNTHVVKRDHTLRVAANCLAIATELQWDAGQVAAAEATGLLHDIGRFPQFQRYETLVDAASVDHGELGRKVTAQLKLLASTDPHERSAILCGICNHNKRDLPAGAGSAALTLLKIVRDADKLDIIRTLTEIIKNGGFNDHPELLLNVDPDGPVNPALLDDIARRRTGSYSHMKSLADMQLMQVSWVYDLNYAPSFRLLLSRGLLEGVGNLLPATKEIAAILKIAENHAMEKAGLTRSARADSANTGQARDKAAV